MAFFRTPATPPDLRLLPDVIHPVIIVPGLLGTWPPNATGKLDPMTKLYGNLHAALRAVGYAPGESLFEFPFDWRLDIDTLAHLLANFIAVMKRANIGADGGPILRQPRRSARPVDYRRVDIVGHSYGGVVARAYAQGEGYGSVRRLVQVATPNMGVIAAYHAYEGGDSTYIGIPIEGAKGMLDLIAARESNHPLKPLKMGQTMIRMARGRADVDLLDSFRNRMPAIHDLLPLGRTGYLYRLDADGGRTAFPYGPQPGYPVNRRLERISTPDALLALAEVEEVYSLYSTSHATLHTVQVGAPDGSDLYPHGRPLKERPEDRAPGDTVVESRSARISSLLTGDPAPRVPIRELDAAAFTGHSINHVQIFSDPVIVRHLTAYLIGRPDSDIGPAIWDGPTIDNRRPNLAALFV